ncbi:hypothetical protein [Hyalangium versicolor]|uniref:hypothetical protein n=1 Tax=Hyalangium versicolor TaxID=2861190 RepID=UPI001CCF9924|nr:hypothetical protein [Hyalangium versicolor]
MPKQPLPGQRRPPCLRGEKVFQGGKRNEPASLVKRAERVLHQPTDSRPRDDHFHVRIRCAEERAAGCAG